MKQDTRDALKRFEEELLAEARLEELAAGPAFEDPDQIFEPEEKMIYCNYANDYGRALREFAESGGKSPAKSKDRGITGLMVTVCLQCAAILGVLIYMLEAYF